MRSRVLIDIVNCLINWQRNFPSKLRSFLKFYKSLLSLDQIQHTYNKISAYLIKIVLLFTYDQKVHHLMAVCPDLVIIISRSDEPPFAKDQPREQQLC